MSQMKATTYLCGGINGLSDAQCRDWREVAKGLLLTETLDPMRRDYRGREDDSVVEIVNGDLRDIRDSDYVLVNATRPSWGTAMEIVYAAREGKPVVAFVGDAPQVSPWVRFHCEQVFTDLSKACAYINSVVEGATKEGGANG